MTFACLLVLTASTVGASYLSMPQPWHTMVGMAIAVTKATLVIAIFMHVLNADGVTKLFVASGFFWLSLLIVFLLVDELTRSAIELDNKVMSQATAER